MDWENIKENYSNYLGPYKNLKEEFVWLNNEFYSNGIDTDERWNNMSSKEKQLQRLYRSKSSKKTEGFRLGLFNYEDSILDLVEAINLILRNLKKTKKSNIQITRLIAHLYLQKKYIDFFRNPREIKNLFYDRIKYIIYDCLNGELEEYFIKKVNILYFESKLEIAQLNFESIKSID
ncbi:uncharacterized protein CHSO_2009 [Chryseobacterium sp. StRB126]|uniref:hypothetical protein n=1 Tax=Chryseobacterium sp. StRB126 TaxID=878220 RepID=UPI0004E99C31|nr:hypothetical protein [Chryseobacterium sp. StRB126]BAP31046.1 uncharacterized protein CHSO_2009 [Chryseobacterium sp. StRB126]